MLLYPRSFLGLLLAGFTLVILPLVGALAYSAWNTERLAGKSRTAVFNASQAARASRSLVDRIAAIERVAQQMALLNDPEIILADEPTGNLDPDTSEEIVLLLRQISQSGTAVLARKYGSLAKRHPWAR